MENLFKKHSIQQQCSVYFCIKIFFKSYFVWLIWPFECLILMILTMTKYHENLLSDSPLSLLFIAKFFSSLETKMVLKTLNKTFLRITLYFCLRYCCSAFFLNTPYMTDGPFYRVASTHLKMGATSLSL